ncbi:MAG: ArsA-related P-loop ATPase, partial [Myxococcota bacterium]|nr:ArsA-related P-loop ATPase [Myxococcota bacterium]
MTTGVAELITGSRIVVCCGAGGVGKTTVATGLALAAARRGRRVLALTVDPSRRLAETLGVRRNLPAPVPVPYERLAAAGVPEPVELDTWMLDPQLVADRVVRRFASS